MSDERLEDQQYLFHLEGKLDSLRQLNAELLQALERTLEKFKRVLSIKPVRDASETISEAEAVIQKAREATKG